MLEEERKDRRKSLILTLLLQSVMLLVLYFLVAWREPFPPIEEFGIELGFVQGGNRSVPTAPVQQPQVTESIQQPEANNPEQAPETVAEPVPDPPVEEVNGDEPIVSEEIQEAEESPTESPEEASEAEPTEEAPVDVVEEPQEEPAAAPVIDDRALFKNSGSGEEQGASLQLTGWVWDFEPTPYDDSSETGKVVYQITIDREGYILKVVTKTSTLTPTVEKYYRQAVERLTFSKTSSYKPAPTSTGTITFIIKAE